MTQINPPYTILVIDDNETDFMLLGEAVRMSGLRQVANVRHISDSVEARDFFDAVHDNIQLILLDLNMPKMDGRELLAHFKSKPEISAIPIIMTTNSDYSIDAEDCLGMGADGFLRKPQDFMRLVHFFESIRECLELTRGICTRDISLLHEELKTPVRIT